MKEIVNKYRQRFFSNEKKAFRQALREAYEALGYNTQNIVDDAKLFKSRNVLVGNFKTAKTVIVVPYDTPKKTLWFSSPYYPQNGELQMKKTFAPTYLPLFISYVILLGLIYLIPGLLHLQSLVVLNIITFSYLLFLIFLMVKGIGNKHNATRNDASLILAYDLAKELVKNHKNDVAFAFTDRTTYRIRGSLLLQGYLDKIHKTPKLIALYCLGNGDTVSISCQKGMRKIANQMEKAYHNDIPLQIMTTTTEKNNQTIMEVFKDGILISSGTMKNDELYVGYTGTSKDTVINESMMTSIKDMLLSILK